MQNRDYEWFLSHYDELYRQYGKSFLAIKNENVIGTFSSFAEGVKRTSEHEPLGTFIVQECNGDASAYTNYIASTNFMN